MAYDGYELFSGACRYRSLQMPAWPGVREGTPESAFPWSERHLRCVWANSAYRPPTLLASDGRRIIVDDPGRWNLEAGPDFLDARLRTAPDEALMRGDVELHIRPADWRRHGHAGDPRYRQVIAHVTYFEGTLPEADLPPSVLQIALRPRLKENPLFSFESLDLPAYPFATPADQPPCARVLKDWSTEQRLDLLESAGEERLRQKTVRLAEALALGDPEQILYEELMGALGYKQNQAPFHALARRLTMAQLRADSRNDPASAYALLAGVAGLLPGRTHPLWDDETRIFVRSLWDFWWRHQATWQSQVLEKDVWELSSIRPVNNPLRRLSAAAALFTGNPPPLKSLIAACTSPEPVWREILEILGAAGMESYWGWHSSLSGRRLARPAAVIGSRRAATLLANVLVPWAAAVTARAPDRPRLRTLPAEDDNRHVRHATHTLFGRDYPPALHHSGLRQQGLLQIFNDFCLNSRNGCRGCPLPGVLADATARAPHGTPGDYQKKQEAVAST